MVNLKDVTLILFDEASNFHTEATKLRIGNFYKEVILVQNRADFDKVYTSLEIDQKFNFACHVSHAGSVPMSGYLGLINSSIEEDYQISAALVSSGDSGNVMNSLWEQEKVERPVYLYNSLRENIKNGKILPYSKGELLGKETQNKLDDVNTSSVSYPKVDYAIITALYEDEFEEVEKIFDWLPEENIQTKTKLYRIGHLKGAPDKKIVASIPTSTGMVDSAIIATQMLDFFRPKYLFMSGVCGGSKDLGFGDIVLAKKIFTFQKGKISDVKNSKGDKLELFDKDRNPIDYNFLYDNEGKQIRVSIETFEIETESVLEIDPLLSDHIIGKLSKIKTEINESLKSFGKEINIHFDSMACSTMVINKAGFFDDKIKVVDRKTVAVEMESYGVARACRFANNGETKFVIFKAVMDNTVDKDDNAKRFAAHTSAQFLKNIIYDKILS